MAARRRRPLPVRVLRGLLALVVLVLLVVHVGGGWFFSGQIESDGLRVDPYEPVLDLAVVRVSRTAITLDDAADQDSNLRQDATYGLEYDAGYGLVSGPPQVDGDEVTRTFRVVAGDPPRPGDPAGLDRGASPREPEPGEDPFTYRDGLGRFTGVLRTLRDCPTGGDRSLWGVLVHGKGGAPSDMDRMAGAMRGIPVVELSYRNDTGAPPDPSHRYNYGRTEWQDLAAALRAAHRDGAQRVVLGGESMGGAIVAAYLEHVPPQRRPVDVVRLVLDAPMLDFGRTVAFGASQRTLPGTPIPVPPTLTWVAKQLASARFDVDWKALDYSDDLVWLDVPTLLVHGADDQTVPVEGSRDVAAAATELVTYREVAGAGHVESWNVDPAAYTHAVRRVLPPKARGPACPRPRH